MTKDERLRARLLELERRQETLERRVQGVLVDCVARIERLELLFANVVSDAVGELELDLGDALNGPEFADLRLTFRCRECGCTDDDACAGGCHWVEPNLCSRCAGAAVTVQERRILLPGEF